MTQGTKTKELGGSDGKSNPTCWLEKAGESESEDDLLKSKCTKTRVRVKASVTCRGLLAFISCIMLVPKKRAVTNGKGRCDDKW